MLVRPALWVGEWRCPGERRGWTREVSAHFEIGLQRVGAHLRVDGRDTRVIDATVATLQPAGVAYRMASPTGHPQTSTVLLLDRALVDELRDVHGREPPPHAMAIGPAAALRHRALVAAPDPLAREEAALAVVRALFVDAAARRGRAEPGRDAPASWRRLVRELQHAVATRYAERLSLAELARSAGCSPYHASRVFHAVTGETLHRHLRRMRLRVALHELAQRGGALAGVALATGFSSHSHFSSAFRAEFGRAPSSVVPIARGRARRR